jgi:hypothetical protein
MSTLRDIQSRVLTEGRDGCIDDSDLALIRQHLPASGPLSTDDLMVLAELRTQARSVCPAFDQQFFPAFKAFLLADGRISSHEQFLLLRMLYGGGGIDEAERRFLKELRQELKETSPEFEALYRQAMRD